MCAITGVYSPEGQAAEYARLILHFLQNRGLDTAGIYTLDRHNVNYRKGMGSVKEVFGRLILPESDFLGAGSLAELTGTHAVGHTRYQTTEQGGPYNAQPFTTKTDRFVVIMSHNGHINSAEVGQKLRLEERIKKDIWIDKPDKGEVKVDCDVVPIMYTFTDGMAKHNDPIDAILQGADDVMRTVSGAYTVSAAVYDKKTGKSFQLAFKDPHAIRPGFYGRQNGTSAVTSETFALEKCGFRDIKPIKNAEVVIFYNGETRRQQIKPFDKYDISLCQFEQGYFSRALSCLDGRSINHGRFMEGMALARKIQAEHPEWKDVIDFVAFLPKTPLPIAKGVAKGLGVDFKVVMEKDDYDPGREFITRPDKRHTKRQSVHWDAVCGRNFILVDDSIVRGETMGVNLAMLREAGAVNIYVASGYPRIEHPCYWGVDMKTQKELIACGKTDAEIAKAIGADATIFLSQDEYARVWNSVDIDAGIRRKIELGIFSPEILEFVSKGKKCNACVTGKSPTQ
jgi:amidophosphoribosyltransferase